MAGVLSLVFLGVVFTNLFWVILSSLSCWVNRARTVCVVGVASLDLFASAGLLRTGVALWRWRVRILRRGYLPLPARSSGKLEYACVMAGMLLFLSSNAVFPIERNAPGSGVVQVGDAMADLDPVRRLQKIVPAFFLIAPEVVLPLVHAVAAAISYRNPAAVLEVVAQRLERRSAMH